MTTTPWQPIPPQTTQMVSAVLKTSDQGKLTAAFTIILLPIWFLFSILAWINYDEAAQSTFSAPQSAEIWTLFLRDTVFTFMIIVAFLAVVRSMERFTKW